jgi:hypothetical protein
MTEAAWSGQSRKHRRWFELGVACLAVACVTAGVVASVSCNSYLARYQTQFEREAAEFREQAARYRRPVQVGDPLDGNAASWYRKGLPHVSDWSDQAALAVALKQGFRGYSTNDTRRVNDNCLEIHTAGVREALRCTRCDWTLKFGVNDLEPFDRVREGYRLSSCLVLHGHQAAHDGDVRGSVRSYLESVAVGCDMAQGSAMMSLVGLASVHLGLTALAQLVISIDDTDVLRDVSGQLSVFEGKLPDANTALRHERLWLENALSLEQLDSSGRSSLGRFSPKVVWAAWRLSREEHLLRLLRHVTEPADRNERMRLLDDLKKRAATSRNALIRNAGLERAVDLTLAADDLVIVYRALQAAIELQDWRAHHHRYPPDAAGLRVRLDRYGIRYEPLEDGDGYRFVGPQGWKSDAVILEREAR